MPFQSEKQRRYLWANEPEIARDWTDTYGSRVKKFDGGTLYNTLENQGITSINNPLRSLQEGHARHMDQNFLLEQALNQNRITEDQYKRMGGYNVLQNAPRYGPIKATPGDVGLASFGYNTVKGAANLFSEDAERGFGDIGFWDSIRKNYQGAKEGLQGDELELYSSITNPRSAFQDDYNYNPRQTMAANWSELDDAEAQNVDTQRRMELARLAGMEQYPTEDEDNENNWLMRALSMIPLVGKNTRSGAALRMLGNKFRGNDGIMSAYNRGYNRGQPRDPNFGRGLSGNVSWAGQQYDKQYGAGQYHIKTLQDRFRRLQKSKSTSDWNKQQKAKVEAEIRARQQATHEARQASTPGYGADPGGRQSVDTSGSRGPAGKEMM